MAHKNVYTNKINIAIDVAKCYNKPETTDSLTCYIEQGYLVYTKDAPLNTLMKNDLRWNSDAFIINSR